MMKMTLYHTSMKLSIGMFSHTPLIKTQRYPTITSYWLPTTGGRYGKPYKRVRAPVRPMTTSLIDGCGLTSLSTKSNLTGVICYRCIALNNTSYYSIGENILSIMLSKKFHSAKKRIYPLWD